VAIGRRIKYLVILGVVLASGLTLLASTQTWYTLHLDATADHPNGIDVPGTTAAPALTALALAGLALAGALAISGRIARVIVGVLGLLLAACVILSAATAIADPIGAGLSVVTKATGIAGTEALTRLVARSDATLWPAVALAGGILAVLCALAVLLTTRAWPDGSKRYRATRFEAADDGSAVTAPRARAGRPAAQNSRDAAIDNWDDLSAGDDPTR
jgi:uncharacterized membrane protein (TIGR02234 family)